MTHLCLRAIACLFLLGAPLALSCSDDDTPASAPATPNSADLSTPPKIAPDGALALALALPAERGVALSQAGDDFAQAVSKISGLGAAPAIVTWDPDVPQEGVGALVHVNVSPQGPETGYTLARSTFWGTQAKGLEITARTELDAMYGVYDVLGRMGVRYHHPEQTFWPKSSAPDELVLPWEGIALKADATAQTPRFGLRGFHEHTQHPTPMSDYYLRPKDEFRPYVGRYLQWLARNRQNAASFHMLKSVDLEAWRPYMSGIIDQAHELGIKVGMVTSFVDEQQNNFKIIVADKRDDQGALVPDETQIREVMTSFHQMGFDFLTFQIGSSEFTKPSDADVLRWLDVASATATGLTPELSLFAWIHTTCSLKADDGDYFYHLPGQAPAAIGTWIHTVMFHTLEHPAPVYDCENFNQQREFMISQEGKRDQVYFPESAWWLGFDNNMPLALPLTGWTRAWDIQEELKGRDVFGHITFTTGREWSYWQYDHYLTQATWDDEISWEDYLQWIAPMFGQEGPKLVQVLDEWTQLQKQHILFDNPEIYFYLAGELEQDEVGEKVGILARRPKLSFQKVVDFDDEELAAWRTKDFEMLGRMRDEYAAVLAKMPQPATPAAGAPLSEQLTFETWAGLYLHVKRLEHAIALYQGAQDVRSWLKLYALDDDYDNPQRQVLQAKADEDLRQARAISDEVEAIILEQAAFYRYPDEILIEPKRASLTTYKIGYLQQTHTAFFWHRRDDQLERLILDGFAEDLEAWVGAPELLFSAKGDRIKLEQPDDAVAGVVLASFIPQLLFAFRALDPLDGKQATTLLFAQDHNENFKPDAGTEVEALVTKAPLDGEPGGALLTAELDSYTFIARDDAGAILGKGLQMQGARFELQMKKDAVGANEIIRVFLSGQVASDALIGLMLAAVPDGIDLESATNLLEEVFKVPDGEELPELLDIKFRILPGASALP